MSQGSRAQGSGGAADYGFPPHGMPLLGDEHSDDLPRTFRREKEARAREARDRAAQERAAAPSLSTGQDNTFADTFAAAVKPQTASPADIQPVINDMPYPASVRRFDVPFFHLVGFFLKAVIAAIPALILLGVVLWLIGAGIQTVFPDLAKMKILIGFGA